MLANALAATLLLTSTAEAEPSCVFARKGVCALKVDHRDFKIEVDERGKIVIVFDARATEAQSYVNVQDDFGRLQDADEMAQPDAQRMETELSAYDGATYTLPHPAELRASLGFPADAVLAPDEYQELVRVHIQLVLSLSTPASTYLTEIMGLDLLEAPTTIPETPATEKSDSKAVTETPEVQTQS